MRSSAPASTPDQPTPDPTQDGETAHTTADADKTTAPADPHHTDLDCGILGHTEPTAGTEPTASTEPTAGTDLDDDDYLDFLIAGYDPDETPPDPHDRFPRQQPPAAADEESCQANPDPPVDNDTLDTRPMGLEPSDDPPPF